MDAGVYPKKVDLLGLKACLEARELLLIATAFGAREGFAQALLLNQSSP